MNDIQNEEISVRTVPALMGGAVFGGLIFFFCFLFFVFDSLFLLLIAILIAGLQLLPLFTSFAPAHRVGVIILKRMNGNTEEEEDINE